MTRTSLVLLLRRMFLTPTDEHTSGKRVLLYSLL